MTNEFFEQHLRTLYRFLGHTGFYSRVGSLDYATKKYEDKLLFGEDEVIKYARQWNGKRNIFIGRGRRDINGKVVSCGVISFDIDPIRQKGVASSHEQHTHALNAGRRIMQLYPGGYLSSSGNGALLLYHCGSELDLGSHYPKEATIIKDLQKEVEDLDVKIDSTNYTEAVIKALGTMSTKGDQNYWRCSKWIDFPILPYRASPKLQERLITIKPEESKTVSVNLDTLDSAFKGDRSTADYHLVSYLKRSGVRAEDALQALRANPLGRQIDEKDQARLITKIYGTDLLRAVPGSGTYFSKLFDKETEQRGIETGIGSLDKQIRAIPKGEITTLGARSGYGKTSFGTTIAEQLRSTGKRVLYFSTEMQCFYIMHKMVAVATGISTQRIIEKTFTNEEEAKVRAYGKEFEASPITICDEFQPTLDLVKAKVIEHKPDLIIFDHISQVATHWEYVAQFARGLKEIAKAEKLPVLMLAELNEPPRAKNGEVAPSQRSDIRGSQEILFLSALFMLISNPYEVKTQFQPVIINIAKNRYGISGVAVNLTVDKETGKFIDKDIVNHDDQSDLD